MITIAICNTDEEVITTYASDAVPRVGELINFPHKGSFRILAVAHRISDDNYWPNEERLIFVEVIIDLNTPIKEIG